MGCDFSNHGKVRSPGTQLKRIWQAFGHMLILRLLFQKPNTHHAHLSPQVDDGPCTFYIGEVGSGNYVKMIHNGIE
jgi:hypothetical protein